MKRSIVHIDEEKCDGCGLCVSGCAEGALAVINGKARLVKESYCDGLGACLGVCPQDAITVTAREADPFSAQEVSNHSCPGSMVHTPSKAEAPKMGQWPVQLRLVPVNAPFWQNSDLLLAADCVPPSFPGFHEALLRGRRLIIACPKLDDTSGYLEKLTQILAVNDIKSLAVAIMEVPCCSGLERLARAALAASGKSIPISIITIGVDGRLN